MFSVLSRTLSERIPGKHRCSVEGLLWVGPDKVICNVCSSVLMKLKVLLMHWNNSQTGFLCLPEFWVWFLVLPSFSSLIWYLNGKDPIISGLCLLWNSGCLWQVMGSDSLNPLNFMVLAGHGALPSLPESVLLLAMALGMGWWMCVSYCELVSPFNLKC